MKAARLHRQFAVCIAGLGVSAVSVADTFTWTGGAFVPGVTAPNPLSGFDVLEIDAGTAKVFNGVAFTNQAVVNWNADSLTLQNAAVVANEGRWDAFGDNALNNGGGSLSSFTNTGHFRKSAGAGSTSIGTIAFVNSGEIEAASGAIVFGGGNATFNAGTRFTGAGGVVAITSNASFAGAIHSQNLSLRSGTFAGTGATLSGNVELLGGALTGSWRLEGGQLLTARTGGNKILNGAAFVNDGRLLWQTAQNLVLQNGAGLENRGTFGFQDSMTIANGGGSLSSLTNDGVMRVAAGETVTVSTVRFVNGATGVLDVAGTLNFGGGNATFAAGTQFIGAGSTRVTGNARFSGAFTSGNLSLQAGTFTGNDAAMQGTVGYTGGALTGGWTLAPGATLTGEAGGGKLLSGASFTNRGTVAWLTSQSFTLQNGSTFDNEGVFDMQVGAAIANGGGSLPRFTNSGVLVVAARQSASVGTLAFVNDGGDIDVGSGGTLTFGGGNASFNRGTRFSGAGSVQVTSNAGFSGAFRSANLSLQAGNFNGADALVSGDVSFSGGAFTGSWGLAPGATLRGAPGASKTFNGAALINRGTIAWQTTQNLALQNGAGFDNEGVFDFQSDGSIAFTGGSAAGFTNSGLIVKTGGTGTSSIGNSLGFANLGTVEVRSGTIGLPSSFVNAGTLTGTGRFTTNLLTNSGHVAPGASPGTLTFAGNFVQSALGILDIELESITSHDLFRVMGNATLGGTLALACFADCSFAIGDEMTVFDVTGQMNGSFASVTLAGFATGAFDVIYDTGNRRVLLRVTETVTPVPEPGTYVLLLAGLALLAWTSRRRQLAVRGSVTSKMLPPSARGR